MRLGMKMFFNRSGRCTILWGFEAYKTKNRVREIEISKHFVQKNPVVLK